MRRYQLLATGFAVPFLTAGLLSAAEPVANGKAPEALLKKLNDAFITKDAETIRLLLSDDHTAILNRGQRLTREDQLKSLADLNLAEYRMQDVKVAQPAKDLVIITYQANQKGTYKGKELPSPIMVSAVWSHQNGKWLEVLYQETPIEK